MRVHEFDRGQIPPDGKAIVLQMNRKDSRAQNCFCLGHPRADRRFNKMAWHRGREFTPISHSAWPWTLENQSKL